MSDILRDLIAEYLPFLSPEEAPSIEISPTARVQKIKPRTDPRADKLFRDSYEGTSSTAKVTPKVKKISLSNAVDEALASDGVITARGDDFSVQRKGRVGGFSKMPARKGGGSSDADLLQFSRAIASGENVDPTMTERVLDTLTESATDPKERKMLRQNMAISLGQQSGEAAKARADEKFKERELQLREQGLIEDKAGNKLVRDLQQEQIKSARGAASGEMLKQSQEIGSPKDALRAYESLRASQNLPSLMETIRQGGPLMEIAERDPLYDAMPVYKMLRSFMGVKDEPYKMFTDRGDEVARMLAKITNSDVDNPDDLIALLELISSDGTR